MGIPICGACRRPIEERVVTALGKFQFILKKPHNFQKIAHCQIKAVEGLGTIKVILYISRAGRHFYGTDGFGPIGITEKKSLGRL